MPCFWPLTFSCFSLELKVSETNLETNRSPKHRETEAECSPVSKKRFVNRIAPKDGDTIESQERPGSKHRTMRNAKKRIV
jgi:hypothetical protein